MPNWNEILNQVKDNTSKLDSVRREYIEKLSNLTKRNTIVYYSGWLQKSNLIRHGFELGIVDSDKTGFMSTINGLDKSKGLDLILHTPGGSIAATESIVYYLKQIFGNEIRAIIPQIAMSAGTMIACSCKEIIMGKHSNLGPIDPQLEGLPTHGIIEEFKKAKKEIKKSPNSIPVWQTILSKYRPTLIGECKKAIKWSEEMVTEWLISNMLSDKEQKAKKAKTIVGEIGNYSLQKSHERHIHSDKLKELGMNITDLEKEQELQDAILSVHHSCIITLTQSPAYKIVENQEGKAFIQMAQPPQS